MWFASKFWDHVWMQPYGAEATIIPGLGSYSHAGERAGGLSFSVRSVLPLTLTDP